MRGAFARAGAGRGHRRAHAGVRPARAGRFFQWFQTYEYIRNFLSRYAWMRRRRPAADLRAPSPASAARRCVAVGGFDPACLVEDYELIHRLHRHRRTTRGLAWRVARARRRAGAAPTRRAARCAFLRQRRRWFGGFLQTQYWYRDMVGNRRYGSLGTSMLPVKALDTLQPLYGLTAFAPARCWFVVTGRLASCAADPAGHRRQDRRSTWSSTSGRCASTAAGSASRARLTLRPGLPRRARSSPSPSSSCATPARPGAGSASSADA